MGSPEFSFHNKETNRRVILKAKNLGKEHISLKDFVNFQQIDENILDNKPKIDSVIEKDQTNLGINLITEEDADNVALTTDATIPVPVIADTFHGKINFTQTLTIPPIPDATKYMWKVLLHGTNKARIVETSLPELPFSVDTYTGAHVTHYVRVRAIKDGKNGKYSNTITVQVPPWKIEAMVLGTQSMTNAVTEANGDITSDEVVVYIDKLLVSRHNEKRVIPSQDVSKFIKEITYELNGWTWTGQPTAHDLNLGILDPTNA